MSLFHSEAMLHISLYTHFDDAPQLSVLLAQSGNFSPTLSLNGEHDLSDKKLLPDNQGQQYRQLFTQSLSQWQKISDFLAIPASSGVQEISTIKEEQLRDLNAQLSDIWSACLSHKEKKRTLDNQQKSLQHLLVLLDHFHGLDIDLSLLKLDFEFLDLRIGIIPLDDISRLTNALAIEGYFLSVYLQQEDKAHVIVAGSKQHNESINAVLESASFHALQVPEEFHECPDIVYKNLAKQQQSLQSQFTTLQNDYALLQQQYHSKVLSISELLTLAKPYAILSQKMKRNGQLVKLDGWIPKEQLLNFKARLKTKSQHPVVLKTRKPEPSEYKHTPSYLLRPNWLKPFIQLVANYGIPGYREFDPSWFFSLSYILMFGLMFGDIGHGATIILASILIRKKWPDFFSFFLSIGISSTIFGFIYGSLFAFEHVITPLWMSPMEDSLLMLKLAFLWGVCFIIFLNMVNIYNSLRSLNFKQALFTSSGLSGLFFYLAILWLIMTAQLQDNSTGEQWLVINILLVLLPLFIIFIYKWKNSKSQMVERFLVSFIETYEVILSYLSNTLSFLRLAAFALNHSALAIAILTLAAMTDGPWHWVNIILGNLFILVLEGAIVAIQALRLEYYEGFSRYFKADGFLFTPLQLSPEKLLHLKRPS